MSKHHFLCLPGVLLLVCLAPMHLAAQSTVTVLAEVNGQKITQADLQGKESDKLLQAEYQYYQAERKALDDLIDQRLLAGEAARQHISVDQLLQKEVNGQVKDPTEDQLRVYYEGLETQQPYDSVRDKILDHIRQGRIARARAAYLESLRKLAKINIALSPPSADIDLQEAYVQGNRNAPVLLVEFADYQCPFCQKVYPDLLKLEQQYGGRVALAYKDFPLPMHANAEKAAEAARCAGEQGKFWEYHDALFQNKKLEIDELKSQARGLQLDGARFDKCLDSGEEAAAVHKSFEEGTHLGLAGTPSFFVNGHFFSGAVDYNSLREIVDQQLAASLPSPKTASSGESSRR